MHGGSGGLAVDCELSVFTTKWLGDDIGTKFRDYGADPDHSAILIKYGLKPGDRPGTDLSPQVWSDVTLTQTSDLEEFFSPHQKTAAARCQLDG